MNYSAYLKAQKQLNVPCIVTWVQKQHGRTILPVRISILNKSLMHSWWGLKHLMVVTGGIPHCLQFNQMMSCLLKRLQHHSMREKLSNPINQHNQYDFATFNFINFTTTVYLILPFFPFTVAAHFNQFSVWTWLRDPRNCQCNFQIFFMFASMVINSSFYFFREW